MKLLFLIFFCLQSLFVNADNLFNGEFIVTPGTTHTYTLNFPEWNSIYENYANVTWNVSNGTVITSTKTSITIQWDNIPQWLNGEGTIDWYEDLGGTNSVGYVELRNFVVGVLSTCNGVLGTPANFINFGFGTNPGPPLSPGSISYQYLPVCNITPGYYTLSNNTIGCNSGWRGLIEDHTPGDIDGYMLMIDGDNQRGEVYRATVTGLTQAFGFEFSAYLANLNAADERPNIQFEVYDMANNLIGSSGYFTVDYDINDPWKRLSFMFNLPKGTTSVQIILVNENNNTLGNDFVVDDISFAPCFPPILASFSTTDITEKAYTCNNGSVQLYSRWPTPTIPFGNPGFQWQRSANNGATWQNIVGATTMNYNRTETIEGIYKYRMYAYDINNPSQNFVSNSLTYYVQKLIVNSKTYDFYGCNPTSRELSASYYMQFADTDAGAPTYNYNFTWSPATNLSNTTISNPTISLPTLTPPPMNSPTAPPPTIYNYNLAISNTNFVGCNSSANQIARHFNPRKVAIPTAFTPDGDGYNDLFRPINIQDYPGSEFWVWNRYGNLVFNSTGPTLAAFSWNGNYSNGQPADPGNYVWKIVVAGCPNNIFNGNGTSNPYGNVQLIR